MICIIGNNVGACLLALRQHLAGHEVLLVRREGVDTFADPVSFVSQTCEWQVETLQAIGVPVFLDREYKCQHSAWYQGEIKTLPDFTMNRADLEAMKAKHVGAWGVEHPDYSVQRTKVDFDSTILAEAMRELLPIAEASRIKVNASRHSIKPSDDDEIRFSKALLCEHDRSWIDLHAPSAGFLDLPSQHIYAWEIEAKDLPLSLLGTDVVWDMSPSKIVRVMHGVPGGPDLLVEALSRNVDVNAFLDALGVDRYTANYVGRMPSPRSVEIVRWAYKGIALCGPQFGLTWQGGL